MSREEISGTFCSKAKKMFTLWYAKIPLAYLLLLLATVHYGKGELEQAVVIAYGTLVAVDMFTKWLSISHDNLICMGIPEQKLTFIDRFNGILLAFNEGKINSEYLIKGFATKLALFVLVMTAVKSVFIMTKMQDLDELALLFLALNELLSVLENLRDIGNKRIGVLVNFVQSKMESKLKWGDMDVER